MIIIKNLTVASLITSTLCFASNALAQNTSPPADAIKLLPPPAVNVDRQLLRDIKQFVKFAHKVKFFYPSQAVADTNWDKFIAETIVEMSQARSYQRQEIGLRRLREIAPFMTERKQELPTLSDGEQVVTWEQIAARTQHSYTRSLVAGELTEMRMDPRIPDSAFSRVRYGWRTVYLPLYLSQHASEQGRRVDDYRLWDIGTDFASLPVCMSTMSGMWGEIHHFWPYFEQVDVNWRRSLTPLLKACTEDVRTERIMAINREFKKLQDNHVSIGYPLSYRSYNVGRYPYELRRIEGKTIVVGIDESLSGVIEIGDELLSINDVPFEEMIEQRASWLMRSDHVSEADAVEFSKYATSEDAVKASFKKQDGDVVDIAAKPMAFEEFKFAQYHELVPYDVEPIRELEEGLWKLNLYNLTEQNAEQVKSELLTARGVVIDLRQYPNDPIGWREGLSWFLTQPVKHDKLHIRYRKGPALRATYKEMFTQTIDVSEQPLNIPVVALSSRDSLSQTEHALTFVKNAGIPVVGVPTAGINGDRMVANYFGSYMDGGSYFSYTGLRVDNGDGSVLIGRGVQPDIYVPRTIDSIVANEDNQLSAAIEYLKDLL